MDGRTDVLEEGYQRFSQGDLEGALDLWSDDFVWEGGNSPESTSGASAARRSAACRS